MSLTDEEFLRAIEAGDELAARFAKLLDEANQEPEPMYCGDCEDNAEYLEVIEEANIHSADDLRRLLNLTN